ncbi:MAG: DUF4070 domain-containing protein [Spirochaetes bacterium]|nr:DUF4070 domain-containing protein [Spirochaetota bacterium]
MKILMVYPKYPETFWSFKHALKFVYKKATNPPLGLLTIAGLLPQEWEKKIIDMNLNLLKDKDILWADYVFISAMSIQKESVKKVILQCNKLGIKVVAGGPLFTSEYADFNGVDHFLLNEGEITIPQFLNDLENRKCKHIYKTTEWADIEKTPPPEWSLINMKKYGTMSIQYSRGCPFDCEFCDITLLYGRKYRTKTSEQIIKELENLYQSGWNEDVFFVDDNFIGNKAKLKREVLPEIQKWLKKRRHPFNFFTQASINIADDEELMNSMTEAGFKTVFIGIETPDEDSLAECSKLQNKGRDLVGCIKKIQSFGLQVQGGFIVGFDNDKLSIFDRQIKFIQKSGIVTAMVGLLNAPIGTRLYNRLNKENRLVKNNFSGNNTSCSTNIIPQMNYDKLIEGYKKILKTIYSPKNYYKRVITFFKEYKNTEKKRAGFNFINISAFFKSVIILGIIGRERIYYWKLFFWSLFKKPALFPMAISFAIYGFHFRKIFNKY